MKKFIIQFVVFLLAFILFPQTAFAHVVVKPSEVGVGAFQTFTVGVPNEKDNPTVALKLLIPEGIKSVSPNVKQGWKIDVKKSGEGEDATVTEIDWTGGTIPEGQRDDFFFSAQVPASETTVSWKAYQTYQDGTVVSWDQTVDASMSDDKKEEMEKQNLGPASTIKIINDFKSQNNLDKKEDGSSSKMLSIVAIALSAVAIGLQLSRKK